MLINKHILHWLFCGPNGGVIKSFDVCTEQWNEMPLPRDIIHHQITTANLSSFEGRLCLSTYGVVYHVYLMEKYGVIDSWVKVIIGSNIGRYGLYPVICSKSGEEILVWSMRNKYFWFNNKSTKNVFIKQDEMYDEWPYANQKPRVCIRSLVQLPLSER